MKKDNIVQIIYDIMETRLAEGAYSDKYTKIEDKTLVQSFYASNPLFAADVFDEIFDEIHPY